MNAPSKFEVATWLILLFGLACSALCSEPSDTFEKAAVSAQQRVVKVYGAKVGSTPGYASGVIVSADGHILTANGTYLNGDRVRVVLSDGSAHVAVIVRRSRELQLAMLKLDVKTALHFDLTKPLSVEPFRGQWVLAISNAFKIADGLDPSSVMLGIVSLRTKLEAKRGNATFPYEGDVLLLDMISSNPGAPGGAVVDAQSGELLGMIGPNLESRSAGTRLNYAIPVAQLNAFVIEESPKSDTGEPSKPKRVSLGIQLFRLGGKDSPAYVDHVDTDFSSEVAPKPDDVILSIGEERIRTVQQYDEVVARLVPGQAVELTVKRGRELIQMKIEPIESESEQP